MMVVAVQERLSQITTNQTEMEWLLFQAHNPIQISKTTIQMITKQKKVNSAFMKPVITHQGWMRKVW